MTTREQIWSLMNGADWACAYGLHEGLAGVCHELAGLVEPEVGRTLESIALHAVEDLRTAAREWAEVSSGLRELCTDASPAGSNPMGTFTPSHVS